MTSTRRSSEDIGIKQRVVFRRVAVRPAVDRDGLDAARGMEKVTARNRPVFTGIQRLECALWCHVR